MRRELMNFRADPVMAEALRDQAAQQGTTVSHLLRDALSASIYSSSNGETMNSDTNPFKRIMPAAQGDLEAQRSFVADALRLGVGDGDFSSVMEGLVFARLAAAQGGEDDVVSLLILMGTACEMLEGEDNWSDFTDALNGEALAIVSLLAERGVDWADRVLPAMAEYSTSRAAELAKIVRSMMPAT